MLNTVSTVLYSKALNIDISIELVYMYPKVFKILCIKISSAPSPPPAFNIMKGNSIRLIHTYVNSLQSLK